MRTLFILVTLLCVLLVPLSVKLYEARQQRLAVQWVLANGGYVSYDYQREDYGFNNSEPPTDNQWLRSILGNDFFDPVENVSFRNPGVDDISPVTNFSKLDSLVLFQSRITDVSSLAEMPGLKNLYLDDDQIASAVNVTKQINLESIHFSLEGDTNLHYLSEFTCPIHLNIVGESIKDLSHLENASSIESLFISEIHVKELPSLAQMKQLESFIFLHSNKTEALPELPSSNSLTHIHLSNTKTESLEVLKNQHKLSQLMLINNQVKDITALTELKSLKLLWINEPGVTDYSPLRNLNQLEDLHLYSDEISELKLLLNLKNLETLYIGTSKVTDFAPLKELSNLRQLMLFDMDIEKSEIDKLKKALPNCVIEEYKDGYLLMK